MNDCVIMAGGKGTRIASVNSEIPKPMIPVNGKPILQHQVENLKSQGFENFIFVVGHLKEKIMEYFGDGKKFGVKIEYIEENEPLGTAGALFFLKNRIKDDFLLLCGDIIFDVNFSRFFQAHKKFGGIATILTHPNSHPYDSSVIVANENFCVTKWLSKDEPRLYYKNRVNAGLHILSPKIFEKFTRAEKTDLDKNVLKPLIEETGLFCYDSPEYVKDMGTPDRYFSVCDDVIRGKVARRNLHCRQKAIFLDRDGTINKFADFIKSPDEFELLPDAAEAVKKINSGEFLAIVITNQPVIARGECDFATLNEIHNKMETLLGDQGAFLDGIYFCPHHPHKGFEGERPELKIDCRCRKPKPGLILQAAADFNIDLEKSWMVGDSIRDIECGKNADCKVAGVGTALSGKGDFPVYENLLQCINEILTSEESK